MNKHRFTHCGDLHLGAKPNHIDIRYDDFFDSFKELIERSIDEHCEYILIAGDLFHVKVINSKTLLNVIELLDLAINNNIKVIVIEGNHDKAFYVDEKSWLHFLHEKNYITLLKHKIEDGNLIIDNDSIYEDENIRIIGVSYLGSMTSIYLKNIEEKISKSDKFTVLMLHAAINKLYNEEMGDVNLNVLMPLKGIVDYIALGHIHTRYEYDELLYNPGALENIRNKDGKKNEQKGYYIVSFEGKDKNVDFYNSKQRKIYYQNFKFDEDMEIEEVEETILNYDYQCEEQTILSITILGSVLFNPYVIKLEEIKEKLLQKYQLLHIEIENLINIVINEEIKSSYIDMHSFEADAIKNHISINYPEIKEIDKITKTIQTLKKDLLDKKEFNSIINNMLEDGDL